MHTAPGLEALLFPGRNEPDEHVRQSALTRVYDPARKAVGRPDLRFHDLRHTGAVLAAQTGAILTNGFRDSSGRDGLADARERPFILTGAFVSSDHPLSMQEGATGEDVLEAIITADFDLDSSELIEEGKRYREWCVPAELLNRFPGGCRPTRRSCSAGGCTGGDFMASHSNRQ